MSAYRANIDEKARKLAEEVNTFTVEYCEHLLLAVAQVEEMATNIAFLSFLPLSVRAEAKAMAEELPGRVREMLERAAEARDRASHPHPRGEGE